MPQSLQLRSPALAKLVKNCCHATAVATAPQLLEGYPPFIQGLLRGPMGSVRQLACQSAAARAVAGKGMQADTASAAARPGTSWAGVGPTVTAEACKEFKKALEQQGYEALPTPGKHNNCMYRAVLHGLHGLSLDDNDESAAETARMYRDMVLEFETQVTTQELSAGPDGHVWVAAIQSVSGATAANTPASAVVAAHLDRVRGNAQSTSVELAALISLLDLDTKAIALLVYSPTYPKAQGYCATLTTTSATQARRVIRITHVPASGAGELNHFEAITRKKGGPPSDTKLDVPPAKKAKK